MLTAMNTGHEGFFVNGVMLTSAKDMLMRLITMILTGNALSESVAVPLIRNTIDIVIHLGRWAGKRKVLSIAEISKQSNRLTLHNLYERNRVGELVKVGALREREKISLYGGSDDQKYFS
ncbi:hypothetical protein [endosymbiont 'TC1' of Trimyema compressum]|uniref:hypothetical protein n=1 Tax=endosymbiont 'TC1' of Trimyema compressum TaxID=243899 RepID=UPI00139234CE|nr:hypothetical protein [endosymbiont 'TC1' of Trimyema compressum]